jgi:hypothetical protein
MSLPEETELTDENVLREIDMMLGELMHFEPRTRIVNNNYQGDGLNSAVCQKITYQIAGTEVSMVTGMENTILRHATETFWGEKARVKEIDKAHMVLLQWCLTSFIVGFWRDMIVRFTHDKSCVLKETSPLDVKDARQLVRTVSPRKSTLYETTKGRFFVISDH